MADQNGKAAEFRIKLVISAIAGIMGVPASIFLDSKLTSVFNLIPGFLFLAAALTYAASILIEESLKPDSGWVDCLKVTGSGIVMFALAGFVPGMVAYLLRDYRWIRVGVMCAITTLLVGFILCWYADDGKDHMIMDPIESNALEALQYQVSERKERQDTETSAAEDAANPDMEEDADVAQKRRDEKEKKKKSRTIRLWFVGFLVIFAITGLTALADVTARSARPPPTPSSPPSCPPPPPSSPPSCPPPLPSSRRMSRRIKGGVLAHKEL